MTKPITRTASLGALPKRQDERYMPSPFVYEGGEHWYQAICRPNDSGKGTVPLFLAVQRGLSMFLTTLEPLPYRPGAYWAYEQAERIAQNRDIWAQVQAISDLDIAMRTRAIHGLLDWSIVTLWRDSFAALA